MFKTPAPGEKAKFRMTNYSSKPQVSNSSMNGLCYGKQSVFPAPSCIDGIGAYAGVPYRPRQKIGEMDGKRISVQAARQLAKKQNRIYLVELDRRWAIDGSSSTSPLKFVNHSCRPNTFMRIAWGRLEFYALRGIERGEELTARYGETHHKGLLPCRCGAPACAGFI